MSAPPTSTSPSDEPGLDEIFAWRLKSGDEQGALACMREGARAAGLIDGQAPLLVACRLGMAEVAIALIERGDPPNQEFELEGKMGRRALRTPLTCLAPRATLAQVQALIRLGCDPNGSPREPHAPLARACARSDPDLEVIQALVSAGAQVDKSDLDGMRALSLAASMGSPLGVRKLVELGADVHAADRHGVDALMAAATSLSFASVQELLRLGADVHAADRQGQGALHHACQAFNLRHMLTDHRGLVLSLLQAGADPELGDEDGATPLSLARSLALGFGHGLDMPIATLLQAWSERRAVALEAAEPGQRRAAPRI